MKKPLLTALVAGFAMMTGLGAASAEKVVHVWHTETNPKSREAIANIVKRFEAKHPGIKVEAEALAWGDLEGKIMASLAAGAPPELAHGQPITCAALQQQGLLLPLDDVVQAIGEDNIRDQIKRLCRVGGSYYGLVHAAGAGNIIYRKDLADKLGLKEPETWDDLLANAKALTMDTNGDGRTDMYGMTVSGDNLFVNILVAELTRANGGVLFDETNRPQMTEPEMIELLGFVKELAKYMPPGWEGHGYRETFANMYGQRAAMMYMGYGRGASLIEQYAPENMRNTDYFDVWLKPRGPSGTERASQVDQETWMLFKDSENRQEAIEFLKFFYEDANYLEYVQSVPIHFFPITKSLYQSTAYQETPMIGRWKSWIETQRYYLDNDLVKPTMVVEWKDLEDKPFLMEVLGSGIVRDMVMEVVLEDIPPEEAGAKANKRLETLLKSKGYAKW